MVLRTPQIFRGKISGNGFGQAGTYIGLIRHNLEINKRAAETEVNKISKTIDPKDQIHLVEGKDSATCENIFLNNYAESHGISVFDPVKNPFRMDVAEKASVKERAPLSVLVLDYLGSFQEGQIEKLTEDELKEFLKLSLDAASKAFGISVKKLESEFEKLSFNNPLALREEIINLSQVRQKLIDESNKESKKRVDDLLNGNPNRYVFAMSGAAHAPVFVGKDFSRAGSLNGFTNLQYKPDQNTSPLKQKLLMVHRIISSSNIELLAGPPSSGSWPVLDYAEYLEKLRKKLNQGSVNWSDFIHLIDGQFYYAILHTHSQLALDILREIKPQKLKTGLYSNSWLMKRSLAEPEKEITFWDVFFSVGDYRRKCKTGAINCAKALKLILEEIGNELPDSGIIIKNLLTAPLPEVRNEGAEAAYNTSKQKWRNDAGILWNLVDALDIQAVPERKKKIELAIVSADPRFLFAKNSNGNYIIYNGKDTEFENVLVSCANESEPLARARAFEALINYLEKHDIQHYQLDSTLTNGVLNEDSHALKALTSRFRWSLINVINDNKLISKLVSKLDDPNHEDRRLAFLAMEGYLRTRNLTDPKIKEFSRKYFNDEHEGVRIGATNIFALVILKEDSLDVLPSDKESLLRLSYNDSCELVRTNSTFALSNMVNKDMDFFGEDELGRIEALCRRDCNLSILTDYEKAAVSEALQKLEKLFALKDTALMFGLEGHPLKTEMEQSLKQKQYYREVINRLVNSLEGVRTALSNANKKVEALTAEKADLKDEIDELRSNLKTLSDELKRLKESIKSNHAKKYIIMIAKTCAVSIVSQGTLVPSFMAKDLIVDAGLDALI